MEFDHCGMLNWTHDLPPGSKLIFENVLSLLKPMENPSILEVGTMAGLSLINIMKFNPNSRGWVIDTWNLNENELKLCRKYTDTPLNSIRNVFVKNIALAGLQDRVTIIDGDSIFNLRLLLREGKHFDFIYVDGSHMCLDAHGDLILAWELLNKNGVMGIDDYTWNAPTWNDPTWNAPTKQKDNFKRPFKAVNHFLEKYKGEYKILHKGYRVFLLKTV